MADPVKTFEVCPRWKVRQQLASAEHRVWQSALGLAGAWPDFQPWFLRHTAPGLWGGCRLAALGLGFTRCPGSGSRRKHGSTRWPQRVLSRHRTQSTPWEVLLSLALRNMSSTTLPCLDRYSFPGHSSGGWWPGAFLFDPVKFSPPPDAFSGSTPFLMSCQEWMSGPPVMLYHFTEFAHVLP